MRIFLCFFLALIISSCESHKDAKPAEDSSKFAAVLENTYQEYLKLFPLIATFNGDSVYNDKMYADFTDSYEEKIHEFYQHTLAAVHTFNRDQLNENDRISYDFIEEYFNLLDKDLSFRYNRIPTDQIWGTHLIIGQWASGEGAQPFKTVKDYDNWLKRLDGYTTWLDSAIVYFRKGIAENYTLPQPLVRSMIPQFEFMVTKDVQSNLFYEPVRKIPGNFPDADKKRITTAYEDVISVKIIPAYARMANFLKNEYLPGARKTTNGIGALPDGKERYELLVRLHTTTDKTPDEIYNIGLQEVKRIRGEMEKIKNGVGFSGDLKSFFAHLNSDPKFRPFKTPDDVLNAFRSIQAKVEPNLKKLFSNFPKTPFEIRRTESFRESSASAEYIKSPNGIKPGIFYVPIVNASNFNSTSGMESLFLHEAIPGHHYQISLQTENKQLPAIRRNDSWSNAYVEGWALYCESLGKELGLYTDPYQHMGALGDEMHRAIRLVVDVALHSKNMTREEAIQYMMENEQISKEGATAEIERYISGPGQALGYKMGALKIVELRNKYQQQLGNKFSLQAFHDELLRDGSMPLTVLERKMDRWVEGVK
ncbi:MAG TPA: DUF885 domain-containing protein [Flavitalea sp.]|nr:DUF885 domain-containing protein [Flavitalea sp.]